jgi:hypothetical protein
MEIHLLSIVLELPPAPAARVLLGLWFAVFSARSAAAFLRITVAGPPGGLGDEGRAVVEPAALLAGEVARGEDCGDLLALCLPEILRSVSEHGSRRRWQDHRWRTCATIEIAARSHQDGINVMLSSV